VQGGFRSELFLILDALTDLFKLAYGAVTRALAKRLCVPGSLFCLACSRSCGVTAHSQREALGKALRARSAERRHRRHRFNRNAFHITESDRNADTARPIERSSARVSS
jgi:hypothetical protein